MRYIVCTSLRGSKIYAEDICEDRRAFLLDMSIGKYIYARQIDYFCKLDINLHGER